MPSQAKQNESESHKEIYHIVAYHDSKNHILAWGLEFGTPASGRSLDEALTREVDIMASRAMECARIGVSPFGCGAPEKVAELIIQRVTPYKTLEVKIEDDTIPPERTYTAEFRLYDKTGVQISDEEIER